MATLKNEELYEVNDGEDIKSVSRAVEAKINLMLHSKDYSRQKIIHSCFPGLSCSRYNIGLKLVKKADWKFSLPEPAFISTIGFQEIDPCHKRQYARKRFLQSFHCIDRTYRLLKGRRLNRRNKIDEKDGGVVSYAEVQMAELVAQNPDKYFQGRYDWFFTGGNLAVIDSANNQYVIHATGKSLQNLYVSKVEADIDHIKLSNIFRKRSKILTKGNINPEILELQCFNGTNVSARRRNFISLYTFEDNALKYRFHLYNGSVPFISSTKESNNSANIVTSDLHKTVAIWDLNASSIKPKQLLYSMRESKKDSIFNNVCYIENNMYAMIDERNIYLLDSRQSPEANDKGYAIHSESEVCETNTIVSSSNFNDLIYVASAHKLQALDKRSMGVDFKDNSNIVMNWTHQMSGYPLMLRTSLSDNTEMILLSSYLNGDVRLCENNKVALRPSNSDTPDEFAYTSPSLPIKLPNLKEAYRRARLEGLCLSPSTSIEQRIKYSHCGISFINTDNNLSILIANSNGDIFSQRRIDDSDEEIITENNLTMMKQWHEQLIEINARTRMPMTVTKVENLESLKKVFRCEVLDAGSKGPEILEEHTKLRVRLGKWQQSVNSLCNYKDALAADLLIVWDIDEEEKEDQERIVLPRQEDAPETIIDKWLEQNKIAEVDESALNMSLNVSEIGVDLLNESLPESSLAVDRSHVPKQEKKASKRKYVKGF